MINFIWINGRGYKQITPFHWVTADWNCDGDVYAEYGATFQCIDNGDYYYNEIGRIDWFSKNDIEYYLEEENK